MAIMDTFGTPWPNCPLVEPPAATVVAAVPMVAEGSGPLAPFCAMATLES